jgi:hypothetical protein
LHRSWQWKKDTGEGASGQKKDNQKAELMSDGTIRRGKTGEVVRV